MALDKHSKRPVGLLIVFEAPARDSSGLEIRLGYLVARSAWGKGFATELVQGFVTWCRADPSCVSIKGGVARDNYASARVLEKNGFRRSSVQEEEEVPYVLDLQ